MKRAILILWLLICVSMFVGNAIAEEEVDQRKLRLLAKKLEALITSRDEIAEKQTTDEFAALTPKEVFELRKIHRKIYWPRYARKMNEKQVFDTMEKIDRILFQIIEEKFGPEATLHNLPDDWISWAMDEVMKLEEVKQLTADLENGLNSGNGCKRCFEEESQSKTGALLTSCDFQNFPIKVPFEHKYSGYYKGYNADRVKNGNDDWPCDFRIYIVSRNYRSVDGRSRTGVCVAQYHGGLSATDNKDRFIVGYGSVIRCGALPFEWYLKEAIIFRE